MNKDILRENWVSLCGQLDVGDEGQIEADCSDWVNSPILKQVLFKHQENRDKVYALGRN